MKKMIRYEMSRAFSTLGFKIAMLLGLVLAVTHFVIEAVPSYYGRLGVAAFVESGRPMAYPGYLYYFWLGGSELTLQSQLYFMILPLLAALPFADSFYADASGGYLAEISTRALRRDYLIGKYAAVFTSGAVAALFPLVLSFALSATVYPLLNPETTGGANIHSFTSLGNLYFEHPLVFLLLHLIVIGVAAGLLAAFALLASYWCNYQFLVLISPFLLYILLIAVFGLFDLKDWQPNRFLCPGYSGQGFIPSLIVCGALAPVTALYYFMGRKADVF